MEVSRPSEATLAPIVVVDAENKETERSNGDSGGTGCFRGVCPETCPAGGDCDAGRGSSMCLAQGGAGAAALCVDKADVARTLDMGLGTCGACAAEAGATAATAPPVPADGAGRGDGEADARDEGRAGGGAGGTGCFRGACAQTCPVGGDCGDGSFEMCMAWGNDGGATRCVHGDAVDGNLVRGLGRCGACRVCEGQDNCDGDDGSVGSRMCLRTDGGAGDRCVPKVSVGAQLDRGNRCGLC